MATKSMVQEEGNRGMYRGYRVGVGVESCKIVFLRGTLPVFFTCSEILLPDVSFSHNAERHRQTDRQTDGQTDGHTTTTESCQ